MPPNESIAAQDRTLSPERMQALCEHVLAELLE
jgi:hypothetical protein